MAMDAEDVTEILAHEHREILMLLSQIEQTANSGQRRDMTDSVITDVMRHLAAEEMHVYPALKEWVPNFTCTLDHDKEEHEKIVQMMKDLEELDASDPAFLERVRELKGFIGHHGTSEEQNQFPQLRTHVPAGELLELTRKVQKARNLTPAQHEHGKARVSGKNIGSVAETTAHLLERSTKEVLDDHLRCRIANDVEADIDRNYAPDVVILTSKGEYRGHGSVRELHGKLREHVPDGYEIILKLTNGPYAFIEWRAREPERSVEDGADSFVIKNGKIVFQSIHYSLQETMPL